jgi:ubiquinone/menaquinone biosynthesis C-methylase UbiE
MSVSGARKESEMRVLDLGCGDGLTPQKLSLPLSWQIIGVDLKHDAASKAHVNFPQRAFVCSAAETLPFPASIFDRVVANVALPYTNIAKTLAEIHRVLAPGGTLLASLHPWTFTLVELRQVLLKPKAALYRFFVFANGIVFHVAGRNFGEAFQTERGTRIALQRANFRSVSFRHDSKRWFVEATKPLEPRTRNATY